RPGALVRSAPADLEATQDHRSARGREPADRVDETRLSRAVGADEPGEPAGGEVEGHAVDGGDSAVVDRQVTDRQRHPGAGRCCRGGARIGGPEWSSNVRGNGELLDRGDLRGPAPARAEALQSS